MNRKPLETLEIPESRKLRERAINCHRVAVGARDPQFTLKLCQAAELATADGGPSGASASLFRGD